MKNSLQELVTLVLEHKDGCREAVWGLAESMQIALECPSVGKDSDWLNGLEGILHGIVGCLGCVPKVVREKAEELIENHDLHDQFWDVQWPK